VDKSRRTSFIGNLFRIESAKGKNQQELIEGNDVPYIAASKENNGFNRMVSIEDHEDWVSKGNCLQFIHIGDAAAGHVNYIPNDFIGMNGKSSCAYNDNLAVYSGLFIASIITHTNNRKYSFKDSWTGNKVTDTIIKLPATSDGQPDWDYMKSYMKAVMEISKKNLENLKKADDAKHLIDTSAWKEFRVGEFFHGIRGSSRKMQELNKGKTPVIAAARYNQGIAGFYDVPPKYENAITISCNGVGCGSTYYHDYPFAITGDAVVLKNIGNVPQGALRYIASVYDAYFTKKYSYADKCSADKVEAELIKLPVTPDDHPDWAYMESYMKQIMKESEKIFENLRKANKTYTA